MKLKGIFRKDNCMKKTFYKKVGRRYIPVSEYDSELQDSFTIGSHLITVIPGMTSYRRIDPEFAPLIAAGKYASEPIITALLKASDMRPKSLPVTKEQKIAWDQLSSAFGQDVHCLTWPAAYDTVDAVISALQREATMLLSNVAVKNAYDEFMLICKLTKEPK
jgi:hypothetical protein